jgi:hypothetical protein
VKHRDIPQEARGSPSDRRSEERRQSLQLAAPDTEAQDLAAGVLQRYGVTDLGTPSDRFESDHLVWDIHLFQHEVGVMGLGLAERDGTAYLVLLVAQPEQADLLAKSAFFPALAAFEPTG